MAVAIGFRDEAADDFSSRSWRACVEQAQLAVENAAKAIVACFQPVGQTHRPQDELARILSAQTALTTDIQESLNDIIAIRRSLGCPKRPKITQVRFPVFGPREILPRQDVAAAKAENLGSKNRESFQSQFRRPSRSLGGREHVLAAYGDERARRTPWKLFTDVQATFALAQAREAVRQAERVIDCFYPPASTS